ncbi:hypothetical protein [Micromonospora musae]|uniref:hypothetical protein n=1 Tax=Micromonospora musae TaxID=1894970 RepID=UPI0033C959E5
MDTADLAARLECVGRTWTPQQRLHLGDVAWASAHGDGSAAPDIALTWGDPLWGFADIWLPESAAEPATTALHLASGITAHQLANAIGEILQVAPHLTAEVSLQQTEVVNALSDQGFRRADGPWFAQLWRGLADLSDLPSYRLADGYSIRRVRRDELMERVEVHRRCWDPVRIKQMLDLPVTGDERGSRYSIEKHLAVIGSPVYREDLDLVVEAPDGSLAAFGLGWLDLGAGSVLFEPVGTVPAHAKRGLARALCAELLRVARVLGATQAVVGPRGDGAYPVPRRLYEGLGMREIAQFVSFTNER